MRSVATRGMATRATVASNCIPRTKSCDNDSTTEGDQTGASQAQEQDERKERQRGMTGLHRNNGQPPQRLKVVAENGCPHKKINPPMPTPQTAHASIWTKPFVHIKESVLILEEKYKAVPALTPALFFLVFLVLHTHSQA